VTCRTAFTADDRAFIEGCPMFFIATADAQAIRTVRTRAGCPDSCRAIDDRTLVVPDYDGNGMYRTWGNVLVNPHVGMLFLDFERPRRLRVNGAATVATDDPLLDEFPGAVFMVRVSVEAIFPNCPATSTRCRWSSNRRMPAAWIHPAGARL
jgi:predicted pyridoxine 5'-phosphate oxidase superfamily flavin-nucleotide-binding protein